MISSKYNTDVYTDFQGLSSLKAAAGQQNPAALEKVAEQFEAIFLQTMLKSMRAASLGDGILDSDKTQFYQQMFDQQIAMDLANKRQVGIADLMIRQLSPPSASTPTEKREFDQSRIQRTELNMEAKQLETVQEKEEAPGFATPQAFVEELWPAAEKAAAELGVAPEVLLAQSALETGWGKAVIRKVDGSSSHNLFNIKADRRWSGESASVSTLEFDGDVARREVASFRAYDSYQQSFDDYVAFVKGSPRYQDALAQAADGAEYVRQLHQAGYATDPEYSSKINKIMSSEQFSSWVEGVKDKAV